MAVIQGPPVTTRNELIYLLYQAAELEHSLLCQYLFTAFTMRQAGEGVTPEQATQLRTWSAWIYKVAIQEMSHLALACNILTAVGGAPNLRRPNFPQPEKRYSLGIESELAPFGLETIERYVEWEKPDWVGGQKLGAPLLPPNRRYSSIGDLYGLIASAFQQPEAERWFIGPERAQITNRHFPFQPPLIAVVDPASALAAIEQIVEEGEGTPPPPMLGEEAPLEPSPESHYATFCKIRDELKQWPTTTPAAAWPTAKNPIYAYHYDSPEVQSSTATSFVSFPPTRTVGDLFTATYDLMCQFLMRLFAHTTESDAMLRLLATATMEIMTGAIKPLGEILTRMPVGEASIQSVGSLVTAGPSFEMYSFTQPLPHMKAAWTYFRERMEELADACQAAAYDKAVRAFAAGPHATSPMQREIPTILFEVSAVLQSMVERFEIAWEEAAR